MQPDLAQFTRQLGSPGVGNVNEDQVLRDRGAEAAAAEALGKLRRGFELLARHAPAQYGRSHVTQPRVALRVNAGVIAKNAGRHLLSHALEQREVEAALQFVEELLRRPAFLHKEVLQTGAIAAFAQALLIPKDFRNGLGRRHRLVRQQEYIQSLGEMRLVRQASAHTERVADLTVALDSRQSNIVDLGIRAPVGAAGGRNLEFARQVVELRIRRQKVGDFPRDGGGVDELVSGDPGQWTPSDIAHHVAAGAFGGEADLVQCIDHLGQRLNGEPVQLDVLSRGDVGQVAAMLAGNAANLPQLVRGEDTVGNADAQHEVFGGQALAALAAGGAHAIALGVHAPPLEVERSPLRQHRGAALPGKLAHLVKGLPRILFAFQALAALRFGLFYRNGFAHNSLDSTEWACFNFLPSSPVSPSLS